ncbi:MAG: SLC13 family permease [Oleiphilaceae bacterium]|nr:SLC13 family permease [Oleiphilaceae bacterium]
MEWMGWVSLLTTAGVLVTLITTRLATDLVMLAALVFLSVSGILTAEQALSGFSNSGLITVAFMYVIAAGINNTGGLDWVIKHLLGRPTRARAAQSRIVGPVALLSGFLNNTPVVATFIPAIARWAKQMELPLPVLLMTLSYAAILGGTLTLIGTSTNLIANGLYVEMTGNPGFGLFDITWISLPVAIVGLLFMIFWLPIALRRHKGDGKKVFGDFREYTVEMAVANDGPLVGKSVQEAGLRHLRGLYLVEIERDSGLVTAVPSEERLRSGDRLVFAGDVEAVIELRQIHGLVPSTDEQPLLAKAAPERRIVEAVVSPECLSVGSTIRESRFREKYGAVVLAIARNGRRIQGNLGNIRLEPADTLLLEARPAFVTRQKYSRDFLLINDTEEERPDHSKSWRAWAILLGVIALAATETTSMLNAAMLGAIMMLASGCLTLNLARRSLDGHVLLTIACSFALGNALGTTGAAAWLANGILSLTQGNYLLMLIGTYLLVSLMTEMLTNNAAALLTLPVVLAITQAAGLPPEPFVLTLMMAASASFSTPLGYQTNLMIYGPGGFQFMDFVKAGVPLNIICGLTTVTMAMLLYPPA